MKKVVVASTLAVILSTASMLSAMLFPVAVLAATQVDQQQLVIDVSVGGLAVGGSSQQVVAQVVTTGISGNLTEVRLPVACSPTASLIVQIQGVTGAKPNGTVLGTTTVPGSSLPSFFPSPGVVTLRSLPLSQPIPVLQGQPIAIVLNSSIDGCGIFQGPVGDSYAGGNAYFDARPNPIGTWVCLCDFAGARWDIPFQTVVALVVPTSTDECKDGNWQNFPQFKNQGDCVSFVASGGKNPPARTTG